MGRIAESIGGRPRRFVYRALDLKTKRTTIVFDPARITPRELTAVLTEAGETLLPGVREGFEAFLGGVLLGGRNSMSGTADGVAQVAYHAGTYTPAELGGAVMVDLAATDGAKGLIVESTFTSLPEIADGTMPEHTAATGRRWTTAFILSAFIPALTYYPAFALAGTFVKPSVYLPQGITNQIMELQSRIENVPAECVTLSAGSGEILQATALLVSRAPGSIVAADDARQQQGALNNFLCIHPHQHVIGGDIGFAFGAVKNQGFHAICGAGVQFDRCRKARAAHAR